MCIMRRADRGKRTNDENFSPFLFVQNRRDSRHLRVYIYVKYIVALVSLQTVRKNDVFSERRGTVFLILNIRFNAAITLQVFWRINSLTESLSLNQNRMINHVIKIVDL